MGALTPTLGIFQQRDFIFALKIISGVRQPIDQTPEIAGRPSDKICAINNLLRRNTGKSPYKWKSQDLQGIFVSVKRAQ